MHPDQFLPNVKDRILFEELKEEGGQKYIGQMQILFPRHEPSYVKDTLSAYLEMYRRRVPMFAPIFLAFLAALTAKSEFIKHQDYKVKTLFGSVFVLSIIYASLLYYIAAFAESTMIRSLHAKYAPGGSEGVAESIKFYRSMGVLFILGVIEIWLALIVGSTFLISVVCFFIILFFY